MFLLLSLKSVGQLYGFKYSPNMKKIIGNHQYVSDSLINTLKINQTDTNALYFPFFFKIYDRQAQQANYRGILYVTDSLIIFKSFKKSISELPAIMSFAIKINSLINYQLFESSNGLSVATNNDMEYLFLSDTKSPFYAEIKRIMEENKVPIKEEKKKKKR